MGTTIPSSKTTLQSNANTGGSSRTASGKSGDSVFSGASNAAAAADAQIKEVCDDVLDSIQGLSADFESASLKNLRSVQDGKELDKIVTGLSSIDHPAVAQLCNTLKSKTLPMLKQQVCGFIKRKVGEEKEDLSSLDCNKLKYEEGSVDRANKRFYNFLVEQREEEQEEKERQEKMEKEKEKLNDIKA